MSKVIYPYKKKKKKYFRRFLRVSAITSRCNRCLSPFTCTQNRCSTEYTIRLSKISNLCYTFIDGGKFIAPVKFQSSFERKFDARVL